MMSCHFVNVEMAKKYFEHTNDYYTKNMTNYDRWHGILAEVRGLTGELSKKQFDQELYDTDKAGRKRAGLDCTFSAPKSVGLAMAKDEATRQDMLEAHQEAVKRLANKIEMELLQTRSNGKTFFSRNAVMAEFVHFLARPSESNGYVADLDLHSHLVIINKTTGDGKDLAQEFGKITSDGMIKELGLVYRQELAKELKNKGYELEVTDRRKGYWDIKGFNRETIMEYSNRRKEILEVAQENGITDMQKANQYSRHKKDAGVADYEEILEKTKKELFDSGKIKFEKKERTVENDQSRTTENTGELQLLEGAKRQRGYRAFGGNQGNQVYKEFAGQSSMSELPTFGMDDESRRADLLLSGSTIDRMAKLQTERLRSDCVQCEEKRERIKEIDRIAATALKILSKENYAFSIIKAKHRIMSEGVLENVTAEEANKAMERAGLVKLGRIEREDGKKTKDVFVTTKENIDIEQAIIDRVQNGKGIVHDKVLTMDESRAALDRAEARARANGLKSANFTITNREGGSGEQAEAVHHILVSTDKYIAVDGLAGTGKTTMMERLKWIADEQGIEVKGVCFTGKAADGLQIDSGIESTTIHSFLNKLEGQSRESQETAAKDTGIKQEWDFSNVEKCLGREIWAVDEAGLVDMHLMNQLQKAAEARGAQVLLLGDPDQLPPVGAGEPMRQMEENGMATAHLYDIRRQKDIELLKAVRESVNGDTLKTFNALEEKGNYREIANKRERMRSIKYEMTAVPVEEYKKSLLLVSTNADRKAYNKAIRAEYVERGELDKGQSYKITIHEGDKDLQEKRNFAEKDRIIFTANDKRLGVMNGTMATIVRISENKITARIDGDKGEKVTINMDKYNNIDYAYAVTSYKAQGMTVEKVVADMNTRGTAQTRNALYVDISRAKQKAVVYTDNKATLEKQTRAFAHKVTSKDFEKKISAMRERGGIANNDRYHAPQDKGRELEKALAQIREHTKEAPAIVKEWERQVEAKREVERQKAAEMEKAKATEINRRQKTKEKAPDMGLSL